MFRYLMITLAVAAVLGIPAFGQNSGSQDKNLDVRSSIGDLHIGKDGDAKKAGLPLYPGARAKTDDQNSDQANFGLLTESFGMKLIVAKYESDDPPIKVVDFYRDKLKKYGKVLECHGHDHGGDVDVNDSGKDSKSNELKCEQNSGPVTELKAGTEDNQHIVAIEPRKDTGSTFSIVYLRTHKEGEI
jgi:hypothetical protein